MVSIRKLLCYVQPVDISVEQAAAELGLSRQRVRELARSGALVSRRVGPKLILIDHDSVVIRKRSMRGPGRRLSERSCWAVLCAAADNHIEDLSRSERIRAAQRLERLDRYAPGEMSARADVVRLRCHPGLLDAIRSDSRLSLGGREAAASHHADIVLGDSVDAYVRASALEDLREEFALSPAEGRGANVILRVVSYEPAYPLLNEAVIPPLLLAVDLIDEGDERSMRAGHALIETHRPDRGSPIT